MGAWHFLRFLCNDLILRYVYTSLETFATSHMVLFQSGVQCCDAALLKSTITGDSATFVSKHSEALVPSQVTYIAVGTSGKANVQKYFPLRSSLLRLAT